MRIYPKFFGKRKRREASDGFYRDKIRASKANVDDVGGGVLDAPGKRTNGTKLYGITKSANQNKFFIVAAAM